LLWACTLIFTPPLSVTFDLLWERDGHLEADELKTGRLRPVC
jgi:hypothetical protein